MKELTELFDWIDRDQGGTSDRLNANCLQLKSVCSPLSCRSFPVMMDPTPAVVSAQWLADAIQNKLVGPKLRILDGSWYLPKSKRDTREEFNQKHIPGASFFNIDECCDQSSPYDHMLPTPSDFSRYVSDLGIGNDTHVVVYDTSDFGSFSAPRVWWMFRVFGHSSVSVLDGGFKHWVADGHPVTSDYTKPEKRDFQASLNQSWVKSYEDVLQNIKTKQVQVVDARSGGRFRGTDPEPRGDIQSGHFLRAPRTTTCCRLPATSPGMSVTSASGTTPTSSSTTPATSARTPRPVCGGRSGCSDTARCRCWTGASRTGSLTVTR
uniref:Mercaptopyruvate sulfurtransferase n=1 Tax=Xiphophorus maculatus TaxID=8083 RepID=M3ZFZ0_XIPMA